MKSICSQKQYQIPTTEFQEKSLCDFQIWSFGQHLPGTLTNALTLQASIEMGFSPLRKQYLNLAS